VPFAVVPLGVGLVGEYPGGADLGQVAGKLALQRAILDSAEIHLVVGAEHAQVGTAGVILVVANTTVTGDAAVHLMGDEGPQFLVHVGALAEAITALVVAGHHRHVLQVAMPPFLAYGTVMRVVDHQPFDDAGAERLGFFIVDRNPAVIRGGGHAGHDQPAAGIVFIAVLLDRALAAGAYAPQRRVPAEVGHIEAEGQAGLQQVVRPVDFVVFTIYMNSGHGCTVFLPAVRVLIMEFRVCASGGNGHPTSPPAPSISSRLHEFGSRLAGRWRLADTGLELAAEILDGAAQWLYRARCVGAEGL